MYESHVIDYSAGVWGCSKFEEWGKIQNRAIRYYLGVHQKAQIMAIEGDMGWIRAKVRQWVAMLRLWNKLIQMPGDCLSKKVFTWDYVLSQNWSSEVKEIFCSINVEQVYTTKTVCNLGFMKTECKKIDESLWLASLPLKPKLRTYIMYKKSFITENYVKYCLNRRKRLLTAQIRIGILPLHIETGRFRNVKVEERVCQVCNNDSFCLYM